MYFLRQALAFFALASSLLFTATAQAEEPAVMPAPSPPAAAAPTPDRATAPAARYAPQATDAEMPRNAALPPARLDLLSRPPRREGSSPFSAQWKAGAGLTLGGLLASGVGAGIGIFGMAASIGQIDSGRPGNPAAFGVGVFGCTLSVLGDLSFLVGVPVWISAAVQRRHEQGD